MNRRRISHLTTDDIKKYNKDKEFDWLVKSCEKIHSVEKKVKKIEEGLKIWDNLIEYTIPFTYEKKLKNINLLMLKNSVYSKWEKKYLDEINSKRDIPHFYKQKDFDNKKSIEEIIFNNCTFLKNSKIFYDISKNLYWDTKPIFSYYAISYLFSFYINSYLKFQNPKKHHGIHSESNNTIPDDIKIKFDKYGLFQRTIKAFTIVSDNSIFSDYFFFQITNSNSSNDKIELFKNFNKYSIEDKKQFLLRDLLHDLTESKLNTYFDNLNLKIKNKFSYKKKFVNNSLLFKNYILIFTACNLARYNPYLWKDIYEGKSTDLFINFQEAINSVENIVEKIYDKLKSWEGLYNTFYVPKSIP